jgi:hypothetical protein
MPVRRTGSRCASGRPAPRSVRRGRDRRDRRAPERSRPRSRPDPTTAARRRRRGSAPARCRPASGRAQARRSIRPRSPRSRRRPSRPRPPLATARAALRGHVPPPRRNGPSGRPSPASACRCDRAAPAVPRVVLSPATTPCASRDAWRGRAGRVSSPAAGNRLAGGRARLAAAGSLGGGLSGLRRGRRFRAAVAWRGRR